jgi:hypothetical protein
VRKTHGFTVLSTIFHKKVTFSLPAIDKNQKIDNIYVVTVQKTGFGKERIKSACLVTFNKGAVWSPINKKRSFSMKKQIFAAIVIILTLAIAGCYDFTPRRPPHHPAPPPPPPAAAA